MIDSLPIEKSLTIKLQKSWHARSMWNNHQSNRKFMLKFDRDTNKFDKTLKYYGVFSVRSVTPTGDVYPKHYASQQAICNTE